MCPIDTSVPSVVRLPRPWTETTTVKFQSREDYRRTTL